MTLNSTTCPYCGSTCSANEYLLKHLKDFDWAGCANCGLLLKVTLDSTGTRILSLAKYTSTVKLGFACSQRLNKAFPYSEPAIPEDLCEELKKIMIGIAVNTTCLNPAYPNIKSFKSETSQKWVIENLLPRILPIYHQYPGQIQKIMDNLNIGRLLERYNTVCEKCGLTIPRSRQKSCPFCLNDTTLASP